MDDPVTTEKLRNVPVKIINEDEITSIDQVYDIIENETVDFTIQGRRSVIESLSKDDFMVTADFKKLSVVNAVPIDIVCTKYDENEVLIIDGKNQMMQVDLVELVEEDFKVSVEIVGDVEEGYYVGKKTANPMMITVSGPKSRIESIAEVVIRVDIDGFTNSFNTIEKPIVLDRDGNQINDSKLTFSKDYITASIDVYKTKEINLLITATGNPAPGYVMTNVEYAPKTIIIAGDDNALSSIHYLNIKESVMNSKNSIEDKVIDLQERLPSGVVLVGDDKTAVINITIEKAETNEVSVWPSDIKIINLPEDLDISFNTVGTVSVRVSGPKDTVNKISRNSISPYIDAIGLSVGTYTLEVKSDLPINVNITNRPVVSVNIEERE